MAALTEHPFLHDLLDAVVAGSAEGVTAALRGRTSAERRTAAPVLMDAKLRVADAYGWFVRRADGSLAWLPRTGSCSEEELTLEYRQALVLHLAIIGTASMEQMRRIAWSLTMVDDADAATVLLDRRPSWLGSWAQWILTAETAQVKWPLVRDLVRAGAIERPDAYTAALLRMRWYVDEGVSLAALLDADPEFFARDVWDLIAYRGDDASQRAADVCGWSAALVARVEDRARLLDALLAALTDLSAYRAAWHTKVWKALKPTRAERAERAAELCALLGAPSESVVAFALDELVRSGVPIAAADLTPALVASAKKTVRAALKQLDREPTLATLALGHPEAEIQGEVLDRLEAWGLDDAARDGLLRHVDLLAATQRPRAEALLGLSLEGSDPFVIADATEIPDVVKVALNFGGPLPDAPIAGEPVLGARVEPIATLEELAEALLAAFDDPWREMLPERLVDAALRRCGSREAFAGALGPYAERLREPLPNTLVASAWLTGDVPEPAPEPTIRRQRARTAAVRAARGEAGPLLALPTHAGGWIEPMALLARLDGEPDPIEFAQALLRLAPDGRAGALVAAETVPGRTGTILRCALGGEPVTGGGAAECAARAVAGLDPIDVTVHWGPDEWESESFQVSVAAPPLAGPLREHVEHARGEHDVYGRVPIDPTAFPARRDLACALAIRDVGWNLDFDGGRRSTAVLETLLPATEPLPPLALRLAVLALGSSVEPERLLATDLLIAGIEDGRIDRLPTEDAARPKPNRLAAGLSIVATAGAPHRAIVRDLLDAVIHRVTTRPGPLLVLFDELCAQTGTGPRASRAYLRGLKHEAARALVKREGHPPEAEAQLAHAARVRRARRWMDA